MPIIRLETAIAAPPERVFDLSIDVDVHQAAAGPTAERAVAGVTRGRMKLGDRVTWEATHLGLRLRLTSEIVAWDRPRSFTDAMVEGPFRRMRHLHLFEPAPGGGTRMIDEFDYASPLGPLGWIADALLVRRHMARFLRRRNECLKELAERAATRP